MGGSLKDPALKQFLSEVIGNLQDLRKGAHRSFGENTSPNWAS
jgi:hypothetical protein